MAQYAHPEVLVTTQWVADHANDPKMRLVEVDVDFSLYEKGHIAGAVGWNWTTQLADQTRRDILDKDQIERLAGAAGISNDSTVVLYGDANNWFAAWALWQFKVYGHHDVRLMDGGRKKWELEGRPYTTDMPKPAAAKYTASAADNALRAFRDEVAGHVANNGVNLVDVRSPDEFTGKVIAPPGLNETAQRAGHIPGAKNIPWSLAVQDDGTFKGLEALKALYEGAGVKPENDTIAYCRIGERSSHTWFVLTYLLGYKNVKNYDGSWTEWGNVIGAPIEKTA
ncbi:MAG: sulfurtransferase [Vulcanimicrobiaceae bacterium]